MSMSPFPSSDKSRGGTESTTTRVPKLTEAKFFVQWKEKMKWALSEREAYDVVIGAVPDPLETYFKDKGRDYEDVTDTELAAAKEELKRQYKIAYLRWEDKRALQRTRATEAAKGTSTSGDPAGIHAYIEHMKKWAQEMGEAEAELKIHDESVKVKKEHSSTSDEDKEKRVKMQKRVKDLRSQEPTLPKGVSTTHGDDEDWAHLPPVDDVGRYYKANDRAMNLLMASLGAQYVELVRMKRRAVDVWKELSDKITSQSSVARRQAKRDYNLFKYEGGSISQHVDRFRKIVNTMKDLDINEPEGEQCIQLVESLPPTFN